MRLLADVNSLAILLVQDHPGNDGVTTELAPALRGEDTLVTFGYAPLRVQWLLTNEFGIDQDRAEHAVKGLLDQPIDFTQIQKDVVQDAYQIAEYNGHDVYDCYYIAAARSANVDKIISTDTDFRGLCDDEDFHYLQPVSDEVLAEFESYS
ncbi:type II toxin-antitoxin system VapC family toxin [Halorubellus salinus]|uniref:type II toxin-antitoxin system VapC family toxin n=1 Tax=Halorubellus salinus TaxID=755309 RepID=UPI001D076D12|nr:PIN domain-containing protein [Halorubellus salinus]